MARVPVPRSSPVAALPPVDALVEVRMDADSADLLKLSQLLMRPSRRETRLTERELHRRFNRMLNQVYEYAKEHDSPISQVVADYRDYLTRLSRQDVEAE